MLGCAVLPGNVQDRNGCLGLLRKVRRLFHFLERVIADGAYQGKGTARAVRRAARAKLEIVKRSDAAKGFVVLQKRYFPVHSAYRLADKQTKNDRFPHS